MVVSRYPSCMQINQINAATETKFNGYMAKINGDNGEYIAKVINAGERKGGSGVKVRERYIIGYAGSNVRPVYGFHDAIWIRASRVKSTWAKR